MSSWFLFAAIIYAISTIDGELNCVVNVNNFKDALLFSVETGTTIGYGTRAPSGICATWFIAIWIIYILEIRLLECVVCGLLFLKFSEWFKDSRKFKGKLYKVDSLQPFNDSMV